MIKHNIKYTDFNGIERQEDFYFHLSLPELTRIEAEFGGALSDYVQTIVGRLDPQEMISFLERLILTAYGEKTPDGKSFRKSKELREAFEYSQAYAELFEEMLTNQEVAKKFGEGLVQTGKSASRQSVAATLAK